MAETNTIIRIDENLEVDKVTITYNYKTMSDV
jgi:hypothetical protein